MRPLGYLYKRIVTRPDWLTAPQVRDIYSLSACVSEDFADYINFWRHNGFWLFDSPHIIENLAAEHGISLSGLKLFYYEAYEMEYDANSESWVKFDPEPSFATNIVAPAAITLEGFDITTFTAHTAPECSPLSCNSRANVLRTNEHCLFHSFDEAKQAIESDEFHDCEPGPYRIIAVYSVNVSETV